jgi:antirestriction protein ArdC
MYLLWGESLDRDYANATWMTYKQAAELNASSQAG